MSNSTFGATNNFNNEFRRPQSKVLLLAVTTTLLAGCNWTGSLGGPERVEQISDEIIDMKAYANAYSGLSRGTPAEQVVARNNVIAARMYVMDLEYTQYETTLMREGQLVDFSTKVTSGVLTTTAGLIGNIGTSHALSETATLINGLDSAYNDKILKSAIIQNVLTSMRTARHDQAAIIYANMYCPVSVYPLGFALSDLETYYRAGTFQTGLIKLMQTTSKAEKDAKANQDSNKPAATPDAQATLEANKKEAAVKATTPTPAKNAAKAQSMAAACKAPAGPDVSYYLPKQPTSEEQSKARTPVDSTNVAAGQPGSRAPL